MGDTNFYRGTNYGLDANYGSSDSEKKNMMNPFASYPNRTSASSIAVATDARTANQIKATTEKFNTGAKTIEVSMVTPDVTDSIPNQHLDEIRRLKKLVGGELTLHGPLVEATGVTKQGWDPTHRQQAERQMWSALERGHRLSPDGNIVVTFHASNGLPEPLSKEQYTAPDGTIKEKVTGFYAVDEAQGQFVPINPKRNELTGEGDPESMLNPENVKKLLENQSKEAWTKSLQNLNYHTFAGIQAIEGAIGMKVLENGKLKLAKSGEELDSSKVKELYRDYVSGNASEDLHILKQKNPIAGAEIEDKMRDLMHGEVYLRDSYNDLQKMFTQAYNAAEIQAKNGDSENLKKLIAYRDELKPKLEEMKDPAKMQELGEEMLRGIRLLRSVNPSTLKPLKEFAVNQAGETFSNLALRSFKEFGDSAPIISVENPPAGMGISRAADLREVVEQSRKKFIEKATASKSDGGAGLSEKEAEEQAKKLIGVTWDVGHINMIKKFGYTDETLKSETETIAPFVKHIHLSDNFGMEHTELPMGMGNVPLQQHMQVLREQFGDKLDDIKKVIETGNWYQHFQTTPFVETLQAFGSPIYGMKMQPYWNQAAGQTAGYFAGYGFNPDVHHSIYGSGFSSLPTELGGQMQGGKSRLAGTPNE